VKNNNVLWGSVFVTIILALIISITLVWMNGNSALQRQVNHAHQTLVRDKQQILSELRSDLATCKQIDYWYRHINQPVPFDKANACVSLRVAYDQELTTPIP
jgi:hypothetical protein